MTARKAKATLERHQCPVKGCKTGAKPGRLMCWPHWRRVPRVLQRAVWDSFAWRDRVSLRAATLLETDGSMGAVSEELFEARDQYTTAVRDAVRAVNAKEAANV